jgi:uncharacterized iron-regulated protein
MDIITEQEIQKLIARMSVLDAMHSSPSEVNNALETFTEKLQDILDDVTGEAKNEEAEADKNEDVQNAIDAFERASVDLVSTLRDIT